jgi:hypothetical protein
MKKKLLAALFAFAVFLSAVPANAAVTYTYHYDWLGRLQEVDYSTGMWIWYGLDPAGNRWLYSYDCCV